MCLWQLHFLLAGLGVGTGVKGTQGSFSPPAFLHGPTVAFGAQMFSGAGLTSACSAVRGAGAACTSTGTGATSAWLGAGLGLGFGLGLGLGLELGFGFGFGFGFGLRLGLGLG